MKDKKIIFQENSNLIKKKSSRKLVINLKWSAIRNYNISDNLINKL